MTDPIAGVPDMSSLLERAEQLRAQFLGGGSEIYEGVAGGGAVKVTLGADGEFERVTIRPDVVDPADVPMLEDLVLAAVRDASAQAAAAAQRGLGAALGSLFGAASPTDGVIDATSTDDEP